MEPWDCGEGRLGGAEPQATIAGAGVCALVTVGPPGGSVGRQAGVGGVEPWDCGEGRLGGAEPQAAMPGRERED